MHIYIYDSFLSNKKYESTVAKIETRLTDLGLNGRIIRLGLLQSLNDSVKSEIRKGAKTIVAVGDNRLLHQCINAVMSFCSESGTDHSVPVGFIPINSKDSSLAHKLGVPIGIEACNTLSARRIEKIDLGKINNTFFLSEAVVSTVGTTVKINDSYSIEINETGEIAIINMADNFVLPPNYISSAQDGRLEFCIKTKKSNSFLSMGNKDNSPSIFAFDTLIIDNKKNQQILVDSVTPISTPATIQIANQKLNLIVGKGRGF